MLRLLGLPWIDSVDRLCMIYNTHVGWEQCLVRVSGGWSVSVQAAASAAVVRNGYLRLTEMCMLQQSLIVVILMNRYG